MNPNIIDTQQVREKRVGKTSERANWSDRNNRPARGLVEMAFMAAYVFNKE